MADYRDGSGREGREDLVELHISNLHPKTTARELEEEVRRIAEPFDVRIPIDSSLGLNRGFGFVSFKNPDDLERVMQELHHVDGKEVTIKHARSRAQQQERRHGGQDGRYRAPPQDYRQRFDERPRGREPELRRQIPNDLYRGEDAGHRSQSSYANDSYHRDAPRGESTSHSRGTRGQRDHRASGEDRERERDRERDRERLRQPSVEDERPSRNDRKLSREREEPVVESGDRTPVKEDLSDAHDEPSRSHHDEQDQDHDMDQGEARKDDGEDAREKRGHDDSSRHENDAEAHSHDAHSAASQEREESTRAPMTQAQAMNTAFVLHVANLHPKTTSKDLEDDVSKIVIPRTVRVIMDLETQLSRGFGFVYLNSEEEMHKIMTELKTVDGKVVHVTKARRPVEREKTPGVFLGKKLSGAPQRQTSRQREAAPYHTRAVEAPLRNRERDDSYLPPPRSHDRAPPSHYDAPSRHDPYPPAQPRDYGRAPLPRALDRDTYIPAPAAPARRPVFSYDEPPAPAPAPSSSRSRDTYVPPSRDTYVPPARDTYVPPRDTYIPRR